MAIRFAKKNSFFSKDKKEKGILAFYLPNKRCNKQVCIHSTDLCEKYCYGNCVFRHSDDEGKEMLNTEKIAQENYKVSLTDEFVDAVCKELKQIEPKRVRIHSIGEFYSFEYFEKWIKIIERNTKINFTAYTKSFDILKKYKDLGKKLPENFNILLSVYPDTYDTYADKNGSGQEYVKELINELQEYFKARKYIVCSKEYFMREINVKNTKKCFCNGGTALLKRHFPQINYDDYKDLFNKDEGCEECLKCYSDKKSAANADIYAVLRVSSWLANLHDFLKKNPNKYAILQEQFNKNLNNL